MARTEWISVGALGAAFAPESHALPETAGLVGQRIATHFEDGSVLEIRFESRTKLKCVVLGRDQESRRDEGDADYSATVIRPDFYVVSWREASTASSVSTLLLDMGEGVCTLVRGRLPTREEACKPLMTRAAEHEELTGVEVQFICGAVGAPFGTETARHAITAELVGKRVEYTYSATERYEHIYLNERLYTWHCLAGSEQGLADTDRCHYLKLAPQLYLFVWREKIVPTLGIVVVDLQQQKTTGRIIGYEGFDFGASTSFPVGARLRVIDGAGQ
jgi:hypothetical protein